MSKVTERNLQEKIQNIEERLIEIYQNVISRKTVTNNHTESMIEKSRSKKPDGFYLYTIIKGNDSHGILVYKETNASDIVNYYLYEPNGINFINYGYTFNISVDKLDIDLNLRMVPRRSINDQGGDCAIWCIIIIILWNSFEGDDRWIALDMFHQAMLSESLVRKNFIKRVSNLVNKPRIDYTVREQMNPFIAEVRKMLNEIPIIIPNL